MAKKKEKKKSKKSRKKVRASQDAKSKRNDTSGMDSLPNDSKAGSKKESKKTSKFRKPPKQSGSKFGGGKGKNVKGKPPATSFKPGQFRPTQHRG